MPRGGVKGNSGGKKGRSGRKPNQHELTVRQLMDENWPPEQRAAMVKAWGERAAQGDLEAGKLLMAYTYGKPVEHRRVELVGIDAARAALQEFLAEHPKAKLKDVAPIYAEQFGVSEEELIEELISEAVN